MILNFAKENDFKVSQTSCLALECSGERRTPRSQLIYTWSFSSCCPGFAHVDRAFLVLASRVTTKGGGCGDISPLGKDLRLNTWFLFYVLKISEWGHSSSHIVMASQ